MAPATADTPSSPFVVEPFPSVPPDPIAEPPPPLPPELEQALRSSHDTDTSTSEEPFPEIFDTGSSSNYAHLNDARVINIHKLSQPYAIACPNGSIMHATHEGELDLPTLPAAARRVKLTSQLTSGTLISVGQLCDADCTAVFAKHWVSIFYDGSEVLSGTRRGPNTLWTLSPKQSPTPSPPAFAFAARPPRRPACLPASTKAADIVAFMHAALGSPAVSTLLRALKHNYVYGFPGLTERTLQAHPPHSEATVMGHQDATRSGTLSTKIKPDIPAVTFAEPLVTAPPLPSVPTVPPPPAPTDDDHDDFFPTSEDPNTPTHHIFIDGLDVTGKAFGDLLVSKNLPSSRGTQYLLVVYDYDSNHIFTESLSANTGKAIKNGYVAVIDRLKSAGLKPKLILLDNECSKTVKRHFVAEGIDMQLVPPYLHRRNAAERAIRTWRNHLVAILNGTDPKFPNDLWDHLIQQASLTLNLLRGSRINPKLSAWAQIYGHFDYNRTPLAPPGIRVFAHESCDKRGKWDPKAVEGYYVGPAMDSYRCFRVWVKDTQKVRICERVTWFPANLHMPIATPAEIVSNAISALRLALQDNLDDLHAHEEHQLVLTQLRDTLLATDSSRESSTADPPASPRVPDASSAPPAAPVSDLTYREVTGHHGRKLRASTRPQAQANLCFSASPAQHLELCYKAFHPDTGVMSEFRDLRTSSEGALWEAACAKEIGRLAQGLPGYYDNGRDTITFVAKSTIPKDKSVTYLRIVATYRPQKADPYRIRFTVGGDRLFYDGDTSTRTSDLTTFKIIVNATLSKPKHRCCLLDLADFYLCHRLPEPEYMRIHYSQIPQAARDHYNLDSIVDNDGYIYVRIDGGMYGLKQVGRIANVALVEQLCTKDFYECTHTPGLFRHSTRDIFFCLIVDDFCVSYADKADVQFLVDCLEEKYQLTLDWDATIFSGITLDWDYKARTCKLSMPGYIEKALQRFEHPPPKRPEDSPFPWSRPVYGAETQLTPLPDDSALAGPDANKRLQTVLGTLLYYARAVDDTMLMSINTLSTQQTAATETTMDNLVQLLNYAATHPDATVTYHASDMCLHVHSDASYLCEPKAGSRFAGFFFLSTRIDTPDGVPRPDDPPTPHNGPILVIARRLKEVVSSAAEAELGGLFHNCKEAEPIRTTLEELGFPQPKTPVQTDNTTASGIANDSVKLRRSKAMDMRYFWVKDRANEQNHFAIYWDRGLGNLADYFSKHHPATHHRVMRPIYHP